MLVFMTCEHGTIIIKNYRRVVLKKELLNVSQPGALIAYFCSFQTIFAE